MKFTNALRKILPILLSTTSFFITSYTNAQEDLKQDISVLFIGNSYTFKNDMPYIFQKMAYEVNVNAFVDLSVKGGENLEYHANNPETYEKINSRNWSYVIIQGHSNEFATPHSDIDKKSKVYLGRIIDSIRRNNTCTKIILYMTWGYQNGNRNWEPIDSYEKMQDMIIENYEWMSNVYNTIISPVGVAWQEIRNNHPDINLYYSDKKHPSLYGSYLAASTFFTTILRKSPVGNPIQIDIPSNIKWALETQAYKTVSSKYAKWKNFPEKYPITNGFDVVIANKNGKIYDRSDGGVSTIYQLSTGEVLDEKNPEFILKDKLSSITITQVIDNICRASELSRRIKL